MESNWSQGELIKISKELATQFHFQPDHISYKYKATRSPHKTNDDVINDILVINNNLTDEQNSLIIFPTLSTEKSNNSYYQQNNSCKNFGNQRLSLPLDTIQESELIPKANKYKLLNYENNTLWNLKNSIVLPQKIQSQSNYLKSSSNDIVELGRKHTGGLSGLGFKPELRSYTYFKEYQLPIKTATMSKKAFNSKPPPSPFNSVGMLRTDKSILISRRIENDYVEPNDILEQNEDGGNEELNSESCDEQFIEINESEDEMDLMANLDSDLMNENSSKLNDAEISRSDSESPSEDMLKEVHRLINKKLTDSNLSNQPKPPFINSIFLNIPPVIRFVREGESVSEIPNGYKSLLKWRSSAMTPNVVKRAVKRSGFKLTTKPGHKWIGYFGGHMKSPGFKSIMEHQKINHMPGSFQIGRKDRLWRNVTLLASKKNKTKEFNFLPKTYCLPADLKQLKLVWDDEESRKKAKWILKPPASARGIGIRVISKWSQIPKKRAALIQSYISRPFLINGSKFDLRVYVAVTSCDPLRIYVYREGLVRFASHKYSHSSKNMANRFIHLTNYSVNKKNSDYQNNEDHDKCQGHKWTLQTLFRHLEQDLNIDWRPIWKNIKDCVVKTIISVESHLNSNVKIYCTHKSCAYELFGFDVLLDQNLKPWVLEVNVSPSLHSNSPLDVEVKSGLISDLFNLVGFQLFETSEESTQLRPSSCRSSFSTSCITISDSRSVLSMSSSSSSPSKNLCKTFSKQSSISSTNKIKSRKNSLTKSVKLSQTHEVQNSILDENEAPLSLNSNESLSSTMKNTTITAPIHIEPIDSTKLQRRGFFNRPLTQNEKGKHKFYLQKSIYENPVAIKTITDKLTVDDARIIMESVDEFNRAGNFELVFPVISEDLESYMSYLNVDAGCRYYNCLLVEFMKKYPFVDSNCSGDCESRSRLISSEGLQLLDKYSSKLSTTFSVDMLWSPPINKDLFRSRLALRSSSSELSMKKV